MGSEERAWGRLQRQCKPEFSSDCVGGRPKGGQRTHVRHWTPDSAFKKCEDCQKGFNALWRHKHHCWSCGKLLCAACTPTKTFIGPHHKSYLETAQDLGEESKGLMWAYVAHQAQAQRHCTACLKYGQQHLPSLERSPGAEENPRNFDFRKKSAEAADARLKKEKDRWKPSTK